jgi:hypothetical protein
MKEFEDKGFFINEDNVKSPDIKRTVKDFPAATTVFPNKVLMKYNFFVRETLPKLKDMSGAQKMTKSKDLW